jgi:hypothetical protein
MSNFEFVFSLLVIPLGLSLAEVFGGLARIAKARPRVRVGWATSLLATWTITRTIAFWRLIWRTRDTLPLSSATLLAGTLICGLYYFAGALVLPNDSAGRTGLDDYFDEEKAKVIGALLAAMTLAYLLRPAVIGWESWSYMRWLDWSGLAIIYTFGPIAMLTKRRGLAIGALAALVGFDILAALARALWPI